MKLRTLTLLLIGLNFIACKKNDVEKKMDGIWTEVEPNNLNVPTGCELIIDKEEGTVSLCDIPFIHPSNVVTISNRAKAKLIISEGQMYYKQKKADVLWLFAIAHDDLYFLDYVLDGDYLWVNGDNTDSPTASIGKGRVFMKL